MVRFVAGGRIFDLARGVETFSGSASAAAPAPAPGIVLLRFVPRGTEAGLGLRVCTGAGIRAGTTTVVACLGLDRCPEVTAFAVATAPAASAALASSHPGDPFTSVIHALGRASTRHHPTSKNVAQAAASVAVGHHGSPAGVKVMLVARGWRVGLPVLDGTAGLGVATLATCSK